MHILIAFAVIWIVVMAVLVLLTLDDFPRGANLTSALVQMALLSVAVAIVLALAFGGLMDLVELVG